MGRLDASEIPAAGNGNQGTGGQHRGQRQDAAEQGRAAASPLPGRGVKLLDGCRRDGRPEGRGTGLLLPTQPSRRQPHLLLILSLRAKKL